MADKKKDETPTNDLGQPSNLESSIRDAKGDEKPDSSTIAQVEEVQVPGE